MDPQSLNSEICYGFNDRIELDKVDLNMESESQFTSYINIANNDNRNKVDYRGSIGQPTSQVPSHDHNLIEENIINDNNNNINANIFNNNNNNINNNNINMNNNLFSQNLQFLPSQQMVGQKLFVEDRTDLMSEVNERIRPPQQLKGSLFNRTIDLKHSMAPSELDDSEDGFELDVDNALCVRDSIAHQKDS